MLTEGFVYCNSFCKKLLAVTNGPGNGIARNGTSGSTEPLTAALEALGKASFLSSSLRMVPNMSFLAKIFRTLTGICCGKNYPVRHDNPRRL